MSSQAREPMLNRSLQASAQQKEQPREQPAETLALASPSLCIQFQAGAYSSRSRAEGSQYDEGCFRQTSRPSTLSEGSTKGPSCPSRQDGFMSLNFSFLIVFLVVLSMY